MELLDPDEEAERRGEPPKPFEYQVFVADKGGARNLDVGTCIDPKSLRLSGSTLTWINGGETRTAVLR